MILSARDFSGYHLGTTLVSYPPKNINTEALLVTPENIGAVSLELKAELLYDDKDSPYMALEVARGTGQHAVHRMMTVRVEDWIVVLWDELHVFKDFEFRNTFHFHSEKPLHELSVDPSSGIEVAQRGDLHDDNIPIVRSPWIPAGENS